MTEPARPLADPAEELPVVQSGNQTRLPGSMKIYMTDVSSVETDDTCGMKFWMNKFEGGKGILNRDDVIPKMLDVAIHDDLRALSAMDDISSAALQAAVDIVLGGLTMEDKRDTKKMELLYRRLGQFVAFGLYQEPQIRRDYETLPIDPAIVYDQDPLWVVAYPDRLLRSKASGEVIYREYVPVEAGISQKAWLEGWRYNIRLHLGLAAATDHAKSLDQQPGCGQVMGLSRGFTSILDGALNHPYTWGWRNPITDDWSTTNTQTSNEVWIKSPVWAYPKGLVAWVMKCGEVVGRAQFPLSSFIKTNKLILSEWCARRLHREREVASTKEISHFNYHIRATHFGRATNQCWSKDNIPCSYLQACWNKDINHMPLKSNLYVPNIPADLGETI